MVEARISREIRVAYTAERLPRVDAPSAEPFSAYALDRPRPHVCSCDRIPDRRRKQPVVTNACDGTGTGARVDVKGNDRGQRKRYARSSNLPIRLDEVAPSRG